MMQKKSIGDYIAIFFLFEQIQGLNIPKVMR